MKNTDGVLKVPDVENWYDEFDVRIMANTVYRRLATRFTERTLVCRSLGIRRNREILDLDVNIVADAQDDGRGHHLLQAVGRSQYIGPDG